MLSGKQKIDSGSLWQHPYVDVFKHFKITPIPDWRTNKKQGDVQEIFAKEIGRKAVSISGSISANNYIQIPHPNSLQKSLNLTGRYIYLEVLSSSSGNPFTLHFDFGVAERAHNIRISVSNLFKHFNTSNGFAIQVPLELQSNKWTVVLLDLYELIKRSQLFPNTFKIEGSHSLKSMMLCANIQVRGVYTSDNQYDYVTLPSDMRFKFSFDINRWEEFFQFQNVPQDWDKKQTKKDIKVGGGHLNQDLEEQLREDERRRMQGEIDQLLNRNKETTEYQEEEEVYVKKSRIGNFPEMNKGLFSSEEEEDKPVSGYIVEQTQSTKRKQVMNIAGMNTNKTDYVSGQYIGVDLKRSPKLNQDPILELKHIVGYSADKCLNLKWSRLQNENTVIFTSGGTLIAMDTEGNNQKRFFFGHSAPICCFDINANGALIASAQEGKNSIIRIWEYSSGRCISMVIMPVNTLKCLAFSHDGKYLASAGKDAHNREIVIVWDITRISKGDKPEIVAKQTSDFNILCLKFSPVDSSRMASCGKENIRFWRIKGNGSIRGSAIVLNHHARNTIFTSLDFEYGFKSHDIKESESLKRLFVASKHGMVFQINYHTESLEATYQTNDSAIYSIAVNEAFCVTGSEDTYLRVWPLDFSEFFMEAKHEGTVCAVDISPDGLKVVCGTLYGSLGILDKSNQKYRSLLRSHTDQILNMDFHLVKKNIVTVSKDKTIRLWDVETFDQVYEFSSPIDQPLCVAAHPYLPLFSCGFESGVMRVFDIDKTCVADEFTQFNKPVTKIAYSPYGDFLITCCVDGGVAIHNAKRQHLPIKMLHLEFPPEFVHVAFTALAQNLQYFEESQQQNENQDPNQLVVNDARFAVMGEYGNNVNIYDTNSFLIKHQIQAHHLLRSFHFANNNRDLIMITTTGKLRVYSLAKYEGIFLREISSAHRGNIVSLDVSTNSGYMITGGEDNMLKVWDYEADKASPFYFQSFIGHTYPPRCVMFNPNDNGMVISAGEKDGLYFWSFYGDTKSKFVHQSTLREERIVESGVKPVQSQQSMLERMRTSRKEIKQYSALSEHSFILPGFKPLQPVENIQEDINEVKESSTVSKARQDRQLTYNHYQGCSKAFTIELDQQDNTLFLDGEAKEDKYMNPVICNGFDGFGGAHDNLVWNAEEAWAAYTLNNKVIFENTKTRAQTVIIDSIVQLSTLALSPDKQFLASAEGSLNPSRGNSLIYLYKITAGSSPPKVTLHSKLTFHQKGVQSLAFSNDSKYLISVAVQEENVLAVWDIEQGLVIKSALIRQHSVNQIKVDPYIEDTHLQFCTVGNQGAFTFWRLDLAGQQFQNYDVVPPKDFLDSNFTSLEFTSYLSSPLNTYLILLGASDGSMTAYDQKNQVFIDHGIKKWCISGELGIISCKNGSVVVASSTGTIAKYSIQSDKVFPQDNKNVNIMKADSSIVALNMDELNQEGIFGTANGNVYYLNFQDKIMIKLISNASQFQEEVGIAKLSLSNPTLFITNSTQPSNTLSLWATQSVDQVMKMGGPASPVRFVLSNPNNSQLTIIGYGNGIIRVVSLETLKVETQFQIQLNSEDGQDEVSVGVFNQNGINFAIGTKKGHVYFGSIKDDHQGKPKITMGKIDNIARDSNVSISSLQFSLFDPIGSFLVAFDNGTIKTWQSSGKNEQLMRVIELYQQTSKETSGPMLFDLADCGYQQFDLLDTFDMFENPHGIDELSEQEKNQLKVLYSNKKYPYCDAKFAPGTTQVDLYFSFVSSLQYIYIRNYLQRQIVRRVSLMHFPTCLQIIDYASLFLFDGQQQREQLVGGENVIACVGTKEGIIQVIRISSMGQEKLAQTRGGMSFGGITAIDINQQNEKMIAANQSGEIFVFDFIQSIQGE